LAKLSEKKGFIIYELSILDISLVLQKHTYIENYVKEDAKTEQLTIFNYIFANTIGQ